MFIKGSTIETRQGECILGESVRARNRGLPDVRFMTGVYKI